LRYRRPYFEEIMLERHGLSRGSIWQPVTSTGRFIATAAFLPGIRLLRPQRDLFDHRAFGKSGSPLDRVDAIHPLWSPPPALRGDRASAKRLPPTGDPGRTGSNAEDFPYWNELDYESESLTGESVGDVP
jgi:hypothetical protein